MGHLRERDNLEVPGKDNIKKDQQEVGWGTRTGLIWLRIGTGSGLL